MSQLMVRRPLGGLVILAYLVVAYVIPALAHFLTGFESTIYKDPSLDLTQILYMLVMLAAIVTVAVWNSGERPSEVQSITPPHFAVYGGGLAAMVLFAAVGNIAGLSGWRYSSSGLADNLSPVAIYYVIAPQILGFFGFLEIFCFDNSRRSAVEHRAICLLLAAGLVLVASGIGPMLEAALFLLFSVFPNQIRLLIFRESVLTDTQRAVARAGLVPMTIAAVALFGGGLIVGEQIKTGADRETARLLYSTMNFNEYLFYLVERFSVSWISLKVALSEYTTLNWEDVAQNLFAPLSNLFYRIDVLLGGGWSLSKPYAGSLMRVNYLLINAYPLNEREGSSPGLIAGFVIAFPIPFSIIACCTYLVIVKKIVNAISNGMRGTPTLFGLATMTYYFIPLFSSPIDYMLILDNGPITFVLFAAAALLWSRKGAGRSYANAHG